VVAFFLSGTPFTAVVSDTTGVELFFVARTTSDDDPSVIFCTTLTLSPTKVYYQASFWVLIDLIVEFLSLIIKPFDNQTES
jgi:hypothetical protein